MINMLLNASISGGIVILLWYLTYPFSRKYFKASWHYALLKIIMVFMLFPVGIFAPLLNSVFAQPKLHISEQIQKVNIDAETINTVNTALSDFVFPSVQYPPQSPQTDSVIETSDSSITDKIVNTSLNIPYLQIIWLIVAAALFSNGIRKMHRFKKQILTNSSSNVESETQELFLQCREQIKVHRRITLRTSGHTKTPFVFGLRSPIVVFPETGMNADEKRLAFIHELTHIKNGDLWLKFFAFVISSIHWFNPFAHLLCRKIAFVSEEYCDERVVKTMTQDERWLYGNLILKVVTDITVPQSKFCSTLSASTKNIKRRLFNMMNLKKSRKGTIALSIIFAFALCSLATVYAFAANTNEKDSESIGEVSAVLNNNETAETVTTKIGNLSITTPKGQEPIKSNDRGTIEITLPGGGAYKNSQGDKITLSNGAIIRSNGLLCGTPANDGRKIIIEQASGDIVVIDEKGNITVNGMNIGDFINESTNNKIERANKIDYTNDEWQTGKYKQNIYVNTSEYYMDIYFYSYWDFGYEDYIEFFDSYGYNDYDLPVTHNDYWRKVENGANIEYELNNGTKIIMDNADGIVSNTLNKGYLYIIFNNQITVEYKNGVKVNAPADTMLAYANGVYIIITGSESTVTKANGTSITVPAGTVLDGEGNVISENE